tara:strand:- start:322 stop:795 length:474 start_codon:yes stop_codon:yes gene_type:complete
MKNREGGYYSREVRGRPETPKERKERIFPGTDVSDSLGKGIAESDDEDCSEVICCDETGEYVEMDELEEFNVHHKSSDGKFTSKDKSGCESSYFVDGDRKRVKGKIKSVDGSGRGRRKNSGKGEFKCNNNKKVTEVKTLELEDLMEMIREAVDALRV